MTPFPLLRRLLAIPASLALFLALPTASPTLAEATPAEVETTESSPDSEPPTRRDLGSVPATSAAVEVDGQLEEPAWATALEISLDYETRPGENITPPVETKALLMHDQGRLYVAFVAVDPSPDQIRARLADRDSAWSDDFVGIVLDTFDDQRRAFEFFVNPLGAQMDLFMDDVNGNEDSSWDGIWDSAGRIHENGYTVEMAIPFSTLRFPRSEGAQTWGVDLLRFYPRGDRHRISVHPLDRDRSCYLCQESTVTGFAGVTPGRNIEINPTVTANQVGRRADFPQGSLEDDDPEADLGLTGSWGITPNMTLSATVNPDFSQVEADAGRLDINERFALFFPERRPFFLEGSDFFETRLSAVFTRTVADPSWGLKLTGKEGKNALGAFVAQDQVTNLLLPGPQGSSSTSLDQDSLAATVRYRRDLGDNSAVGGLVTSREGTDYSNRLVGADLVYRLNDADRLTFQALTSETRYPGEVVADSDQKAGALRDEAFSLEYRHSARDWWWRLAYDEVGEDFRADLGFMPRVGYSFAIAGLRRTWHGEDDDWYNRIAIGGDVDRTEDQRGELIEEEYELFFELGMARQSFLWLGPGARKRVFEGVEFDQQYLSWFYEMQATSSLFFYLEGRVGDDIDFANVRPGETLRLEPFVRFDLGRHVRAELGHDYRRLEVDEGRLFTANLSRLKVGYQLNLRTFLRAIVEYTDVERDPDLYLDDVDARSEDLFTQLLFSYKVNPRTVLFLGYSDNYAADQEIDLTQSNRALFFKIGYAWVL